MSASDASRTPSGRVLDRSRAPEHGPLRPFHFPPIERFTLSNGLPVLTAATPGLPVATMSLLLDAGGLHEDPSRGGLASLTADLLESGAGGRTAAGIADALERIGVQLDATTAWDASHLDVTGLTGRIPEAAAILTELVRAPTFPDEEVERLRQEQLAGILQRRADPRALANKMASRFIFSEETPFSRALSGSLRSVEGLSREDVRDFHARHYGPAAASLVIAGDLPIDEARALAEEHFGDWTGPAAELARASVAPREAGVQLVVVDRPGSVQSEIRVGHVGVARDTADYFPLVVMNTILGGAFSSRLNLNLRERHGFTYGVSSAFVMRRLPGPFLVSTAVQTEVTAAALAEILREIGGIREAPVTPEELDDARNLLAGIFPLRLQTTEGVAARLVELALYALPLDHYDTYRPRILAVTGDEVLRAAHAHLRPDELTVVVVGDAAKIREPLDALGLAPGRVVDGEGEGDR